MAFEVRTTAQFDEWFESLGKAAEGDEAQVEIDASVHVLKVTGPALGRPTVDTLNGSRYANMKELRVKVKGMVIRIAFAFDPLQRAILLVGGDKGGVGERRFYQQLIRRADRLYGEHLEAIRKEVDAKREADRRTRRRKKGG